MSCSRSDVVSLKRPKLEAQTKEPEDEEKPAAVSKQQSMAVLLKQTKKKKKKKKPFLRLEDYIDKDRMAELRKDQDQDIDIVTYTETMNGNDPHFMDDGVAYRYDRVSDNSHPPREKLVSYAHLAVDTYNKKHGLLYCMTIKVKQEDDSDAITLRAEVYEGLFDELEVEFFPPKDH
ncbi:PREDICTED: uncharacterized protein LOC105978033 isoform X2 [Erythranthe guttata]|uniref:uncharacterized protein LOC105978033 isoform X2 n=1 Tax=Erythranthe guttata TaxID=4155 RepID=UPI00064D8893|nr:PREDICTED: uncharacterized protein LOC105978033 isoform X2 [Erythranthe guttata]|eukprot:XP_012858897.1 PREDICTED: uncharacterized protein LOC105978033 isoform X2 [Erythranthe guttata]